jgi:hypothetical protein
VLNRAVEICNELITLFTDKHQQENVRLVAAAAEARKVRDGILRRMSNPSYLAPDAFNSVAGFMAFYDNHATNDYGASLPADKMAVRDRLLAAWIAEVVEPLVQLMNHAEEQAG